MLAIMLAFFKHEEKLDLSGRRLYSWALISSILCLFMDIMSIFGIDNAVHGAWPAWLAKTVCKMYVISLALQAYQGFLYAAGEFFAGGSHKTLKRVYTGWLIAGSFLIAVLPIDYYMDGKVVYSYGPSTIATYVITLVLILSTITMAFVENDKASRKRRRAILIWQGCWVLAAIIQFLIPELLLVGFATAFGMVLIYAELENPHEGIDRMTGLYTSNALLDYISDVYQHDRAFSAIYIRLEPSARNVDLETKKTLLIRTANFLRAAKKSLVFRNTDNEIITILKDREAMEREYERIHNGIEEAVRFPIHINYLLIPDNLVAESADEFLRLPFYFMNETENKEKTVIDNDAVEWLREYARMKELIEEALEKNRVEVFYQPFYNVREQRFSSAEALVRIRDAQGKLVPPGKFIPVAEDNGMIVPLGIEIFRQVCEFLASDQPKQLGITHIEINLSIAQFDDDNPADFVEAIMDEYHIDSSQINLEITETASLKTKKIILKNMHKLIERGVEFSLDDFGTGRSNLDYLVEMPVKIVKFDHSFTQAYFKNEKAKSIMETTIALMHDMGLSIVSEGVETKEHFDTMCALGVEFIQGYFFSKPLPKDEFVAFLRNNLHLAG